MALETVCPRVKGVVEGRCLILADVGIARLGGNFEPLTLEDEIDGRDFILGLDCVVSNMVNGDHELGHDGPSFSARIVCFSQIAYAEMMPREALFLTEAADGAP
jgi:hypothetical protein